MENHRSKFVDSERYQTDGNQWNQKKLHPVPPTHYFAFNYILVSASTQFPNFLFPEQKIIEKRSKL
jgi:hypothetical protein